MSVSCTCSWSATFAAATPGAVVESVEKAERQHLTQHGPDRAQDPPKSDRADLLIGGVVLMVLGLLAVVGIVKVALWFANGENVLFSVLFLIVASPLIVAAGWLVALWTGVFGKR